MSIKFGGNVPLLMIESVISLKLKHLQTSTTSSNFNDSCPVTIMCIKHQCSILCTHASNAINKLTRRYLYLLSTQHPVRYHLSIWKDKSCLILTGNLNLFGLTTITASLFSQSRGDNETSSEPIVVLSEIVFVKTLVAGSSNGHNSKTLQ